MKAPPRKKKSTTYKDEGVCVCLWYLTPLATIFQLYRTTYKDEGTPYIG